MGVRCRSTRCSWAPTYPCFSHPETWQHLWLQHSESPKSGVQTPGFTGSLKCLTWVFIWSTFSPSSFPKQACFWLGCFCSWFVWLSSSSLWKWLWLRSIILFGFMPANGIFQTGRWERPSLPKLCPSGQLAAWGGAHCLLTAPNTVSPACMSKLMGLKTGP